MNIRDFNSRRFAMGGLLKLAFVLLWLSLVSFHARADGRVFSEIAYAAPQVPDQRALIQYLDGVETLVIDTSFRGPGTNFAWVVPLPSVPKVTPVSTGFFPTLQFLFQPRIEHDVDRWFFGVFFVGFVAFLMIGDSKRKHSIPEVLAVCFILFLLAGMLLPSLAKARGLAGGPGVEIIRRERVGVYDTVTLSSTNGAALLGWLSANGFAVPTNSLPVIQDYAREGWVFVASKMQLAENSSQPLNAHPLSFTFKTDRAVYPMRLTGIDNNPCKIDLYVFGTNQAAATNFELQQSETPGYPRTERDSKYATGFTIQHPAIRDLVDKSPVVTKLSGLLTSAQMKEDIYLQWIPYNHYRAVRYSTQGAWRTATNYLSIPFVVLLLAVYRMRTRNDGLPRACWRRAIIAFCGLVVCWGGLFVSFPKIPVFTSRLHRGYVEVLYRGLESFIVSRMQERIDKGTKFGSGSEAVSIDWVRQQLNESSELRKPLNPSFENNFFTGLPWKEEDSPGNYIVRQETNDVVAVWYGAYGEEKEFFRLSDWPARYLEGNEHRRR